jgi:hypothetical protein
VRHSRSILLMITCLCLLSGCAGVARTSDFSRTAETLDFDKLAQADYESKDAFWNQQTEYEYFVEVEKIEEDELYKAMTNALIKSGYEISYSNKQKKVLIGERGLRLNEWSSITGLYYRPHDDIFQVFIKNAITQDITGGWRENRAKKVAIVLCESLSKCKTVPK